MPYSIQLTDYAAGDSLNDLDVKSISLDANDVVSPDQKKGVLGILKHIVDQTTPLFKPPFVKNLILCIVLMFTILLCNNTTILWLPEVLNRIAFYQEGHGGDSYLCQMVMKEPEANMTAGGVSEECVGTVNSAVFVPNLVVGTLQPVVMVTAGFVVNYVDKKVLMVVVMILCSGVSFFSTWVPEATLVIVMFGAIPIIISVSYNILTSLLVELFPTYIRAMAVSLVMVCGRLGSASGSKIFSRLIDSHCPLLFQLLAGLLICTAILPLCISLKDGKPENLLNRLKQIILPFELKHSNTVINSGFLIRGHIV
ncbi:uncharacterized protein LOC124369410 [Homalodisca vitripennis]|uniref:uncharacterized protein LOC124369410 n=1 Tax=Homalodisca vitripennis TaxID=197043 RepID=UPI001EEB85BE|nr:uncharacterized protein LOC124369410 [Homalodisca vitripennis]